MSCFLRQSILSLFLVLAISPVYALEVGDSVQSVPLKLLENKAPGQAASIADYKGKLVYLDFWASWCGPCRVSLPILNEIRKEYGARGFEVVAVNVDENLDDALGFLEKRPVDYPILLDPKGTMPKLYDVKGMPTAYLIDENGTVLYKHVGFKKKDRKKIESLLDKYLAGQ